MINKVQAGSQPNRESTSKYVLKVVVVGRGEIVLQARRDFTTQFGVDEDVTDDHERNTCPYRPRAVVASADDRGGGEFK